MKMTKKIKSLITVAIALVAFVGCSNKQPNPDTNQTNKEETTVIRLGVMSASDSAPILLAQEKGYFKEYNVDLELEIFSNGATKQSSIQAGELDAAMVSMIQFVNNISAGLKAKITTTTDGTFPVVLSKNFTEKNEVKVGLMEVSVTNFLADQYLTDYTVEKIFINEMPVRMQMLMADELDMAVLPEPLASNAQLSGLTKKVYGEPDDMTPNAIIFTDEFIENNPTTVANFHKAYNQAVADIVANPEVAKDILIEKLELNPEIKELIVLPTYHQTRIPTESYLNEVKTWTEKLQDSTLNVNYDDAVTPDYVAK